MPLDDDLFRQAIEQSFNAVLITTAQLQVPGPEIVYINPAMCTQSGYRASELLGQTPRILQGPATDRGVLDRLRETIARGDFFEGQAVNYRKDGTPYLVHWNISPMRDRDGTIHHYVSVQQDLTQRVRSERFTELLLASLGEGVFGIDPLGRLTSMNQAALGLLGFPSADGLLGRNAHRLLHPHHEDGSAFAEDDCAIHRVLESGEAIKGLRDMFLRADGQPLSVETFVSPLRGLTGEIEGTVVSFRDITEQLELEAQLEYTAQHDHLTGALNRHVFETLFEREHARVERQGEPLALMLLDIDHFKAINDRYGHEVGDRVLKSLVQHLSGRLRGGDILTRWGGEEFALLLPDTDLEGALALAEMLRRSVADSALAAGLPRVSISIGVTLVVSGTKRSSVFQQVDEALYQAKHLGRNRVCAI